MRMGENETVVDCEREEGRRKKEEEERGRLPSISPREWLEGGSVPGKVPLYGSIWMVMGERQRQMRYSMVKA